MDEKSLEKLASKKKEYEKTIESLTNEICDYAAKIAKINDTMDRMVTGYTLLRGTNDYNTEDNVCSVSSFDLF